MLFARLLILYYCSTHDYAVLDSVHYQLCATFDAPDSVGPYGMSADPFWRHGAGHMCFTFEARRPVGAARRAN